VIEYQTEYHTLKTIDNSRLVRATSPASQRDLCRRLAVGAAIAACLWFYTWQHFECIQIRYQIEQLESQRTQAVQLNQQLHLEVATLRAPSRVDSIARNELGLTIAAPAELAPAQSSGDTVLADARASAPPSRP
jgi:cell division protein FtsL